MGQDIKVSILVPFFKVEQYVGRCVESLFTQTYKNIEYIFVNDCSPDNSMEVINEKIAEYDMASKCKIIVHEKNQGISVSRNDCLDNMTGDYFLFIDSDDYIDKDMVEMLVDITCNSDRGLFVLLLRRKPYRCRTYTYMVSSATVVGPPQSRRTHSGKYGSHGCSTGWIPG